MPHRFKQYEGGTALISNEPTHPSNTDADVQSRLMPHSLILFSSVL